MMKRRDFLAASGAITGIAMTSELLAQEELTLPNHGSPEEGVLGSHWEMFEKMSGRCKPKMSFLEERYTDPEEWSRLTRDRLLSAFQYDPPLGSFNEQIVERVDRGTYVRERILLNTTEDIRIPIYLLLPKNARQPAPAVVVLHDHGGFYFWGKEKVVSVEPEHPVLREFKAKYYAGRSIADELAKRGYVTVAADMLHWGERAMKFEADPTEVHTPSLETKPLQIEEFNNRSAEYEEVVGRTAMVCGSTWSGIIAIDDKRVTDYLITRPEVDESRIGCVGLSVGAVRATFLGALHLSVKASVPVCWTSAYQPMAKSHVKNIIGFTKIVPGLYPDLDWPDLAGLHWPGALMTINGLRDRIYPLEAAREAFQKIERIYTKMGAAERYEGLFFDGPHEFNAEMQDRAIEWLDRWLKS